MYYKTCKEQFTAVKWFEITIHFIWNNSKLIFTYAGTLKKAITCYHCYQSSSIIDTTQYALKGWEVASLLYCMMSKIKNKTKKNEIKTAKHNKSEKQPKSQWSQSDWRGVNSLWWETFLFSRFYSQILS